ncbi:MAG: hypothetical protein QM758_08845 [Armatimonas sp.]
MKNSVQSTYNENRSNPADSRRLLFLVSIALGVLLLLIVPFRLEQKGKPTQIVYAPVWDAPYSADPSKKAHNSATPVCPDNGPFIPILMAEFAVLTIGTLIVRDRLGKSDLAKLESYPGYQRGF